MCIWSWIGVEKCVTEENLHVHYSAGRDVNFPKILKYSSLLAGENDSRFYVSCSYEINMLINSKPSEITFSLWN